MKLPPSRIISVGTDKYYHHFNVAMLQLIGFCCGCVTGAIFLAAWAVGSGVLQ